MPVFPCSRTPYRMAIKNTLEALRHTTTISSPAPTKHSVNLLLRHNPAWPASGLLMAISATQASTSCHQIPSIASNTGTSTQPCLYPSTHPTFQPTSHLWSRPLATTHCSPLKTAPRPCSVLLTPLPTPAATPAPRPAAACASTRQLACNDTDAKHTPRHQPSTTPTRWTRPPRPTPTNLHPTPPAPA